MHARKKKLADTGGGRMSYQALCDRDPADLYDAASISNCDKLTPGSVGGRSIEVRAVPVREKASVRHLQTGSCVFAL